MIKALIFDFAGVVGTDGYWVWLRENVPDLDRHRQRFHDLSVLADRGDISAADYVGAVGAHAGVDPRVVLDGLLARTEINQTLVGLIGNLRRHYKIGLLSNFIHDWLDGILTAHNLYPLFDMTVISSQVRMVKPDPAIFALACARLGVHPSETVFIDDRTMHVEGSIRAGLTGLLYTDVPTLTAQLGGFGIEVNT